MIAPSHKQFFCYCFLICATVLESESWASISKADSRARSDASSFKCIADLFLAFRERNLFGLFDCKFLFIGWIFDRIRIQNNFLPAYWCY
jgi:hypothetical protein